MKIAAARFTGYANVVKSTMFRITNALKENGRELKMDTRAAEPSRSYQVVL
jgi:hypothetical protein